VPHVLAVDLGTGGPKVGLVSVRGTVAARRQVAVPTRQLAGGGAVQDAAGWWEVITAAARQVLATGAVGADQVVAVSCTGQWASTVPVDEDGHPVGDCLLWLDSRGGPHSRRAVGGPVAGYAPGAVARWVRRSGGAPSTSGADPIGHMLFFEHEQPEVAGRARWYLEPVDYLAMRFTGRAAASHASMAGAWLTDNRDLGRLAYDPVLVAASGVPGEKLPPLVATGSVVGEVEAGVARALGLGPGVEVVTGTPDLHSAAAGSGSVLEYEAHLTISTTSWVSCPVGKKKTDPFHQIATVPGLGSGPGVPAPYLVANNHETGGRCLEWVRDLLVDSDRAGAAIGYDTLTEVAGGVGPGANGAIFTPWLAGERSPVDDRLARGGFHNLSLRSTRADLVRAVLEGVAYNSRWLAEAVDRFVGRRLEPIRLVGGGATSSLWCQIHADVLGRRIERVAEPVDANLRGAALLAGLALGHLDRGELRSLVPVDAHFDPDEGAQRTYERHFAEFPRLYSAQKPMFARLNGPR